jgi:hypothetical protein
MGVHPKTQAERKSLESHCCSEETPMTKKEEQAKARRWIIRQQRKLRAETRRSTIYATIYPKAAPPINRIKDYPLIYALKGACQSEVENFLLCLGYGCSDYWLSHTVKEKFERYVEEVQIKRFFHHRRNRIGLRKFIGIRYSVGNGDWK